MENQNIERDIDYLYRGILTLQTPKECRAFFEDLCTASELQEFSRRLKAAKMLKNNCNYSEIALQTGLSSATISRVNRCMKYNEKDGYYTVLERLEKGGLR